MDYSKLQGTVELSLMHALSVYGRDDAGAAAAHRALQNMSRKERESTFSYVGMQVYNNVLKQQEVGLDTDDDDPGVMSPGALPVVLTPAAAEALMKVMLKTAWGADEAICRALAFIAEALASHETAAVG